MVGSAPYRLQIEGVLEGCNRGGIRIRRSPIGCPIIEMGRSDSRKKFSGVARGDKKGSLCCCKGQEAQLLEGLCARPFTTVIYRER